MTSSPSEWTPTPENINALPEPLRRYIHHLETACDPSGDLRELFRLREENAMLRAECARLAETQKAPAPAGARAGKSGVDQDA